MRAEAKANLIFCLAGIAVGLLVLYLKVRARYLGLVGLAVLALMLKPSQKMFILDVQKSQKMKKKTKLNALVHRQKSIKNGFFRTACGPI